MDLHDTYIEKKRWYDSDPVVSLAVNLMEKSNERLKEHCADYIIEEAKNRGLELKTDVNRAFDCFWQRWQDRSAKLFEAMEFFKIADFEFQKEISLEIINYIEKTGEKNQ